MAPAGESVAKVCRRNHIRLTALFGSTPRNGFWPGSDVEPILTTNEDSIKEAA